MATLLPTINQELIATTTVVTTGQAFPCRGYSVLVADVRITDSAQVNFQGNQSGGTTYQPLMGSPLTGLPASVSATATGFYRFNVTGLQHWRPVLATISVGSVEVFAMAQSGGTTDQSSTPSRPRSSVASAMKVIAVGTFASPTLVANAGRKSMWFQNVGTPILYLGLGLTPSATSYHFAVASGTNTHSGDGGAYFDSEWIGSVLVIASSATGTLAYGETT
jgi:hypothetical protein